MATDFNFDDPIEVYNLDFDFAPIGTFYGFILKGSSNLTSIWADPSAGINKGNFYLASSGTVSVINSSTRSLYDFYSTTQAGRAQETLDSSNVVDINVIF
jgi:hypothetical protein